MKRKITRLWTYSEKNVLVSEGEFTQEKKCCKLIGLENI